MDAIKTWDLPLWRSAVGLSPLTSNDLIHPRCFKERNDANAQGEVVSEVWVGELQHGD